MNQNRIYYIVFFLTLFFLTNPFETIAQIDTFLLSRKRKVEVTPDSTTRIDTFMLNRKGLERTSMYDNYRSVISDTYNNDFKMIYNNPNRMPRNIFTIPFFKFSYMVGNAIMPINFELRYQRIISPTNNIEVYLSCQPLDFRYVGQSASEYKQKIYVNLAAGFTHNIYFINKTKQKNKSLVYDYYFVGRIRSVYYNSNGIPMSHYSNVFDRSYENTKIDQIQRYGLRWGVSMVQTPTIVEEHRLNTTDYLFVNTYGQRMAYFNLGMCLTNWINYEYTGKPDKVGIENYKKIVDFYIDILYAPTISVYGGLPKYLPTKHEEYIQLTGAYLDLIDLNHFGARIGGSTKKAGEFSPERFDKLGKPKMKGRKFGFIWSYEIAYYPGVKRNNFIVSLAWGFTIWGNPTK